MDQKRTLLISIVLIVVLVGSIFVTVNQLYNPDLQAYTAQAQKIFNDARIKLEQMRNVTLPTNVNLHVITKQDAVDMWGHPSGTQDLTNIYREEKIYKGLFMMPQDVSLYQANTDWTANWGAATVGDSDIYVIKENFNVFDKNAEATFIHELTHIWQPDLGAPNTYDEIKGHSGLIEGDASFMGDYYTNLTKNQANNPQASVNVPLYLLGSLVPNNVHPMPDTLWNLNFFPYEKGSVFVTALYDKGGFPNVNHAYTQGYIPSSSTQILHPNLYFENKTAKPVNAPTLIGTNWALAQTNLGKDHNTYGEYFIQAMLSTWINKTGAQQVAQGWAGDNFTYYEKDTNYLFTWNIMWDNAAQASEFSNAFTSMMTQTGSTSKNNSNEWYANGRYLTLNWNPSSNYTLIACSTVEAAVLPNAFAIA